MVVLAEAQRPPRILGQSQGPLARQLDNSLYSLEMRSLLKLFLFGIAGGIIGSYIFVSIGEKHLANISGPTVPTPPVTPVIEKGFWLLIAQM